MRPKSSFGEALIPRLPLGVPDGVPDYVLVEAQLACTGSYSGEARRSKARSAGGHCETSVVLTVFGACAVTFMVLMYALERRGRGFILAFACGCALSSVYGFLAGTWPFGVVEALWALIAVNRYRSQPTEPHKA
jgi:hypothetical protein